VNDYSIHGLPISGSDDEDLTEINALVVNPSRLSTPLFRDSTMTCYPPASASLDFDIAFASGHPEYQRLLNYVGTHIQIRLASPPYQSTPPNSSQLGVDTASSSVG
jgi:hypothetical protein